MNNPLVNVSQKVGSHWMGQLDNYAASFIISLCFHIQFSSWKFSAWILIQLSTIPCWYLPHSVYIHLCNSSSSPISRVIYSTEIRETFRILVFYDNQIYSTYIFLLNSCNRCIEIRFDLECRGDHPSGFDW